MPKAMLLFVVFTVSKRTRKLKNSMVSFWKAGEGLLPLSLKGPECIEDLCSGTACFPGVLVGSVEEKHIG